MARPRVFVSSTFFDLKHIRASVDLFIRSLGYESVLSEKGDIAYAFDRPLDESCYVEIGASDIFVIFIGGRYGSAASDQQIDDEMRFFERYQSITRKEYERAVELDLPIYILIEKAVYAEYQTYKANRDSDGVRYAHVDSVNVFVLIDDILSQRRNNPIHTFERFTDIEVWLREQWAGLFRDLLKRTGQQTQLGGLNDQVAELSAANDTLKAYLEALVTRVAPDSLPQLATDEEKRRIDRQIARNAEKASVVKYLARRCDLSPGHVVELVDSTETSTMLLERLIEVSGGEASADLDKSLDRLFKNPAFFDDVNDVREMLGKPRFRRRPVRRRLVAPDSDSE